MDKLKEEIRLVIAFALAVIIIMMFGRMRGSETPAPPVEQQHTAVVEKEEIRPEDTARIFTHPPTALKGEKKRFENNRYILDINTAGGAISYIGLKDYVRPDEKALSILEATDLLRSYTEEYDADIVFSFSEEPDSIIRMHSAQNGLVKEKTIQIPEEKHTFTSAITIHNTGDESLRIGNFAVSAGSMDIGRIQDKTRTEREFTPPEILINTGGTIVRHNILRIKEGAVYENTEWIAMKERYGLIFLKAGTKTKSFIRIDNNRLDTGFLYEDISISPDAPKNLAFSFYAGPSDYFVAAAEVPDSSIFASGPFVTMGRILFTSLAFIQRGVPNWGWSIILLTLVIKILFFPLTQKSLRSMKAMQKVRPYLQEIQKKHKGNPQQMQKELMSLYKEYKINPFGGCLPMLMQFPIFIGFFLALRNSVFLRGAPFGLWISDLSRPDTVTSLGDFNLNILPVLMAATSFWQQKLTPQEPSQKALTYMMPIMFLFLFYNFSSGLLLYWLTMNVAGLVEQYFIHKK